MQSFKRIGFVAALTVGLSAACSPDDYPTEPRFPAEEEPAGEVFTFRPPTGGPEVNSVSVAGSFNGWDATAMPMTRQADGTWKAEAVLENGTHQYKFVINGDQWVGNMCNDPTWGDPANSGKVDPGLTSCQDDGFGGQNAVRVVGPPPAAVDHTFRYVVPAGAPEVTAVNLAGSFQGWDMAATPMTEVSAGNWEVTVELDPGQHEYKYVFNGDQWAGDMCNDPTWGDPDKGGKVDPDGTGCVDGGGNAVITIP